MDDKLGVTKGRGSVRNGDDTVCQSMDVWHNWLPQRLPSGGEAVGGTVRLWRWCGGRLGDRVLVAHLPGGLGFYFRVFFRLALQFRQRPLVVVWRAYGQGRFLEEAAVFVFQGPNKDGPASGSKERLARGTSWLGSQQDFVTPCGVRKRW